MRDLVDMMNEGFRRPVDAAMREYLRQNHEGGDTGNLQDVLDRRQDLELTREGLDYEFDVIGLEPETSVLNVLGLSRRDFNLYLQLDSSRW